MTFSVKSLHAIHVPVFFGGGGGGGGGIREQSKQKKQKIGQQKEQTILCTELERNTIS